MWSERVSVQNWSMFKKGHYQLSNGHKEAKETMRQTKAAERLSVLTLGRVYNCAIYQIDM